LARRCRHAQMATGEIIEDGTKHYRVIGVLDSSTVLDWHIGVSLLEEG